jgi:hypothetical protein
VSIDVVRAWLLRPVTRRERILGAAVTAFVGFWLGCVVGIAACAVATSLDRPTIQLGSAIGLSIAGAALGWRCPKQALSILGARALFRVGSWR